MAELKTKKTEHSVPAFIKKIPEEQKRKDALIILDLMEEATGSKGKMWGTAIIGFGDKADGNWIGLLLASLRGNKTLRFTYPEQ